MAENAVKAAVSGESAMDRLDRILADYGFSTDSKSPRQYFLVSTVKENAEEAKDKDLVEACVQKLNSMRESVSRQLFATSLAH
ncbi:MULTISPECIES: hypothetical protein [Burkholderia]|uniref:Uncharacterized protein n=1 Tax=Burkholderia cenocepacia TaxID=95486 RepID=A0ABD4UEC9_9BURK|nr:MULTISPECIES: hypothetical protein [Burkholderia]ERJ38669.1 hypothetical protein L810_6886 [Burkholderia sp. AU4i]MBR8094567.1 hypothetical protein [Burkholderia cenocepacia]MBS6359040.1 hypothetical protein [Burkholderia sp.]MBY4714721.1 hypothetical protein [Burkholderia cepacia]MBY4740661.1 hypothetical protein [Burkholderia cepacia]